jgi:hypothetical protein
MNLVQKLFCRITREEPLFYARNSDAFQPGTFILEGQEGQENFVLVTRVLPHHSGFWQVWVRRRLAP